MVDWKHFKSRIVDEDTNALRAPKVNGMHLVQSEQHDHNSLTILKLFKKGTLFTSQDIKFVSPKQSRWNKTHKLLLKCFFPKPRRIMGDDES